MNPAMSLEIPAAPVLERAGPSPETSPQMPDAAFQSEFLKTLQARGYINQATHPRNWTAWPPGDRSRPTSGSTPRRPACTSATCSRS